MSTRNICFAWLLITIALAGCSSSAEEGSHTTDPAKTATPASPSFLQAHPIMTWLRKSPQWIGCMLEEVSFRDSVYNCASKEQDKKEPNDYYTMTLDPVSLRKISPLIREMQLEFEHGNLREISITFKDSIQKEKVRELFALPKKNAKMPYNVMEVLYGENVYANNKPTDPNYTRWLNIVGFEHMGAGD